MKIEVKTAEQCSEEEKRQEFKEMFVDYLANMLNENFPEFKVIVICRDDVKKEEYVVDKETNEIVIFCRDLISIKKLHNLVMDLKRVIAGKELVE